MKSIVIIFISVSFLLLGCIDSTQQEKNSDTVAAVAESEVSVTVSADFPFVCGVAYDVDNFQEWLNTYKKSQGKTLILFRNVDNPAIILVYEQAESMQEAEERGKVLTSDEYIDQSHTLGTPVYTHYEVKLFEPQEKEYKIYVALIFEAENPNEWISKAKTNLGPFNDQGIVPVGIGINAFNKNQVYLLAALEDYINIKKNTNTPKEIGKLYKKLGVPDHTMISFWGKVKL
ncbi:MAG: hypothetical protein ABFS32_03400 [Bacteroidota bacterium]